MSFRQISDKHSYSLNAFSFKSSILKNISIFTGGSFIAYFVGFFFTPIIARIYLPEDYGNYALFSTCLALFIAISSFSYSDALILTVGDKLFYRLSALILSLSIFLSVILGLLGLLFSESISDYFQDSFMYAFIFFIPLLILFNSIQALAEAYTIKKKYFKRNAKSKIASIIMAKSSVTGAGFIYGSSTYGLILGEFIIRFTKIGIMIGGDLVPFFRNIYRAFSFKSLLVVIKQFKSYPIYILPSTIIQNLVIHLPILIVGQLYSHEMVGYLSLALSMLSIPIQVIGFSIGKIFLQNSVETLQNGNKLKLLSKCLLFFYGIITISSFGYGIIFAFGPQIFSFIAGDKWLVSGNLASILSTALVLQLVSISLGPLFRVLKKEKDQFKTSLIGAIILIVFMIIAIFIKIDFMSFIYFLAFGITIRHILNISMVLKIAGANWFKHISIGLLIIGSFFSVYYSISRLLL